MDVFALLNHDDGMGAKSKFKPSPEIDRLLDVMAQRNVSQRALTDALKLTAQNFTNWRKAGRVPGDALIAACRFLRVDPMLIRYGQSDAKSVNLRTSSAAPFSEALMSQAVGLVQKLLDEGDLELPPELFAATVTKAYALLRTQPYLEAVTSIAQVVSRLH